MALALDTFEPQPNPNPNHRNQGGKLRAGQRSKQKLGEASGLGVWVAEATVEPPAWGRGLLARFFFLLFLLSYSFFPEKKGRTKKTEFPWISRVALLGGFHSCGCHF